MSAPNAHAGGSGPNGDDVDIVVIGSGPNGLAAAITVARAGRSVVVLEAGPEPGGATRSESMFGPGYINDVGSSTHPLAVASPFMATIDWQRHGLEWMRSPAALAHPLDDGPAAMCWNDLEQTVDHLGPDGKAWDAMIGGPARRFEDLVDLTMNPPVKGAVAKPLTAARFGPFLAAPATLLARRFSTDRARALFAGNAAHAIVPLHHPFTGGFGLLLGASAHAVGWPFPRGGAGEIPRVLAEVLIELGGEIRTNHRVESLDDLPKFGAAVFAVTPRQLAGVLGASSHPPSTARSTATRPMAKATSAIRKLRRFRYGPGACKVDFALSQPIPWADPTVGQAATVHVGGTLEAIAAAEAEVGAGRHAEQPFVLLTQHSLFDPSRAPEGHHTVWSYCHVPNDSPQDATAAIEAQIERFAPGFRDTIIERKTSRPADLERMNANLVGGDVGGGAYTGTQAVFRPSIGLDPFDTPLDGVFLASASTSPGGGVHGMGGHLGALRALRFLNGKKGK